MKSINDYLKYFQEDTNSKGWDAISILNTMGIDPKSINLEQFKMGLEVELEHGTKFPDTNITNDDPILTAKIALAHLKEMPENYYTKLAEMEKEKMPAIDNIGLTESFSDSLFTDAIYYVNNKQKSGDKRTVAELAQEYLDDHTNTPHNKKSRYVATISDRFSKIINSFKK